MSLRSRIAALERDIQQAQRDRELEGRWQHELASARSRLAHVNHAIPLPRQGVDYSFARFDAAQLRARGAMFAVRYLTGEGKALDRAEAIGLSDGGIDLVSAYERTADAMLGGAPAGRADGRAALGGAKLVGMPPGRPIYFTCDFDVQPGQLSQVLAYMHGAKEVLDGRYDAGGYGGLTFVRGIIADGFTYAWQTLAWSNGAWDDRAQLRQTMIGNEIDIDLAYAADFGQWKL